MKKKSILFWAIFALLSFLYFFIKFQSAHWVDALFDHDQFSLLNKISGGTEQRTLDFYQGQWMERVFGPLLQVLSGVLLIMFTQRYCLNVRHPVFAVVIFLFLLITKPEVLSFPVYGEAGAGPVAEAVWLYQNDFNYRELIQQPNVDSGGPKVYLFSIYPGFVALLMKLSPSIKFFLCIYHLINFLLASLTIALFRQILLKILPPSTAFLGSLVLLFLPLFQSLVEVVNMEIMCLFFVVLSAYFLSGRRLLGSALAAMLAAFVKGPGGIACAVYFLGVIYLSLFDREFKKRPLKIFLALGVLVFGVVLFYALKIFVSPVFKPAGTIAFFVGLKPLLGSPKLFYLYLLSWAAFFWTFLQNFRRENNKKLFIVFLSLLYATMWYGLYINVSVMGPRYKLLIAPFLILGVLTVIQYIVRSEKIISRLLATAVLLTAFGGYGLYHPDKMGSYTYGFNELERSLEFRNDLKLDLKLAETIEKDYPGWTIGAPFVIAQILAMPELGYVTKPLDVVVYGFKVKYAGIKNFEGLAQLDSKKVVWIGFPAEKRIIPDIPFPVDDRVDEIIQTLQVGDKRIDLFRGGIAIERMRLIYETYQQKINQGP